MEVYLVGGAVRDQLLDLPIHERDYVVVGSTPEAMIAQGFKPVGKQFPVFLHPETKEEYALARTETKVARGYHGFTFYAAPDVTLEQDLSRRDLTINAIAQAPSGQIIDPYHGQQDLQQKILRHVSEAFVEDPVRVLRLARFAARFKSLGFKVASETITLAQAMCRAGELDALVPERVWQETWHAMSEANPEVYFQVLQECGALTILFSEIAAIYDEAMSALKRATILSSLPEVRFAALVSKMRPEQFKAFTSRYVIPRHVKEIALAVIQHHSYLEKELSPEEILQFLEGCDALRRPERFEQILMACEAGVAGEEKQRILFLQIVHQLGAMLKSLNIRELKAAQNIGEFYKSQKLKYLREIIAFINV